MQFLHIETALTQLSIRAVKKYYLLKASFNDLAGKNLTFCDAAI